MATAKKLPPFMKKTDKPTKGDMPDPKKPTKGDMPDPKKPTKGAVAKKAGGSKK